MKLLLCILCFDGPGFNPTSGAIIFREFACLMTRVHSENLQKAQSSKKCEARKAQGAWSVSICLFKTKKIVTHGNTNIICLYIIKYPYYIIANDNCWMVTIFGIHTQYQWLGVRQLYPSCTKLTWFMLGSSQ